MHTRPRRSRVLVFGALTIGGGALLGLQGWPQPDRTLELAGLILAAILPPVFTLPRAFPEERAIMQPSFVIALTALLLLGPPAALLVAGTGAVSRALAGNATGRSWRPVLNAATAMAAILAAGFAHAALGGTVRHFTWPWQVVPLAAAVLAYCCVTSATAAVFAPLLAGRPIDRAWRARVLRDWPDYFVAACIAAAIVELIDHRVWQAVPAAAVALFFAHRSYRDYVNRLEDEHRRREVIAHLDEGMAVIDSRGLVTLWSDALERIVGCPRDQALGRPLAGALPAVSRTGLSRAIDEASADRVPRTLAQVALPTAAGARILQVRILPVADGVTLLWHDVTERARAELALKRGEARLALAAEGANDGLWEWDLRTGEFYVSGRWRSMLGLPAVAGTGRSEDWFSRVHRDDAASLQAALEAHMSGATDHFQHEHRIRQEDGSYRLFLCRGVAVRGAGRRPSRIAGSMTDTTAQRIAQERLRSAASIDPLTGLCNRAVFVETLGRRLDEARQRRGGEFAALYLDLDRFKVVNDSLGHLVGDELLIAVSRRLESCLRPGSALARLGGDEFAILLTGLSDGQQANAVAFRIQEALTAPFSIGGREVFTSASIGIAIGPGQYTNPDEIMHDADTAMYQAKSRGKARHEMFDADMHARARDRVGLENDLRHAVASREIVVHYQPIVSLASGMCVGFESLVRWSRNGEAISPATFIPLAEELGLIEPLGTWVLEEACRTFAGWKQRYADGGLDCITVNVSSRQLMQQHFLQIVEQAVQKAGLKPCDLRLEITETALMDSPDAAAAVLRELRDFGVKIYLDDFGTGYSSLSHLHKLPVDTLKIDRSFVRSLLLPDRPAIVESILALARTLNTSVVAEGIESEVQARELERLGCTHAQGFFFSGPLSTRAAEELLTAAQPLGPKPVPDGGPGDGPESCGNSKRFEWPEHLTA